MLGGCCRAVGHRRPLKHTRTRGTHKQWNGLLEWYTGLDYWTKLFSFLDKFLCLLLKPTFLQLTMSDCNNDNVRFINPYIYIIPNCLRWKSLTVFVDWLTTTQNFSSETILLAITPLREIEYSHHATANVFERITASPITMKLFHLMQFAIYVY